MKNIFKYFLLLCAVGWSSVGWGQACTNLPTPGCGTINPNDLTVIDNYSNWDWEKYDCNIWAANIGQKISMQNPWCNQSQSDVVAIGNNLDYTRNRGWVLLRRNFGHQGAVNYPYFVLYNRFTGIIRVYFYISENILYTRHIVTLKTNKNNSLVSYSNQYAPNSDKYISNQANGVNDIYVVSTSTGTKFKWSVAEFNIAFDPNIQNAVYSGAELRFDIQGQIEFKMTANLNGTSASNGQTDYNLKSFAFVTKSIESPQTGMQKFISNANKFMNLAKDVDSKQLHKDVMKAYDDINGSALAPTFVKNLASNSKGIVSDIINGIGDVVPGAKAISSALNIGEKILGYFNPKKVTTITVPEQNGFITGTSTSTVSTDYNLTLNGYITTEISQEIIVVKIPGTSNLQSSGGNLSYYNCPLGVFSLQNTINLNRKSYSRYVGNINGVNLKEDYESYIVSNDLIPILNASSGLEIISFEGAISSTILPKNINDTANFNLFKDNKSWYQNYMLNDLYAGRTELSNYDIQTIGGVYPRGLHTVRTPFVDFKSFKGTVLNVKKGTKLFLTIRAIYKTIGSDFNNTTPIVMVQNFELDINEASFVFNPNFATNDFTNLPPFTNYHQNTVISSKIFNGDNVVINDHLLTKSGIPYEEIVCIDALYCQYEATKVTIPVTRPKGIIADANNTLVLTGLKIESPPSLELGDSDPNWNIYYNLPLEKKNASYKRFVKISDNNNFQLYNTSVSSKPLIFRAGKSIEILPNGDRSSDFEINSSEFNQILFVIDYGIIPTIQNNALNVVTYFNSTCNANVQSLNNSAQRAGEFDLNYFDQVYPNPFDKELTVKLSDFELEPKTILIYNQFGITVAEIETESNSLEEKLNLEHLSSGIYLVKIVSKNMQSVFKVIKN